MQVQQCTKLNHEVHRGVPFFHSLSVKRGRQYMYSTTIFPLKIHIRRKKKKQKKKQKKKKQQSRQTHTRDVKGPFDHIHTCICSPLKMTFSVGTSQYKVAICPKFPLNYTGKNENCDLLLSHCIYLQKYLLSGSPSSNRKVKFAKKINSSEVIRGIKLKPCRIVHNISLNKRCFYCGCLSTLVAMAT